MISSNKATGKDMARPDDALLNRWDGTEKEGKLRLQKIC
jgi:hypothetical protein